MRALGQELELVNLEGKVVSFQSTEMGLPTAILRVLARWRQFHSFRLNSDTSPHLTVSTAI